MFLLFRKNIIGVSVGVGFDVKWGVGFDASDFGGLRWLRACTLNVEFEKYPKT